MKKILSTAFLVLLGILLSTQIMSQSEGNIITLTENNSVLLSGPVNGKSVATAQLDLGRIANKAPNGIVYLILDTPGGSVVAGNQLIDFAKSLNVRVKTVCLFCASMGYQIVQNLDERLVQDSSILMSHRMSVSGVAGQIPGEAITMVKFYQSISDEADAKAAKRVGLSIEEYRKLIYDELWMTGAQAVKMKHADKVTKFRCGGELIKGTRVEVVETLFGPVSVTYSKCPLVQGFLSFKLGRATTVTPRNEKEVMTEIKRARRMMIKEN